MKSGRLRGGQMLYGVEIVDNGAATEIEEVLASPTVACPMSLPVPHVGQGMLNRHPFPQLRSPVCGQLSRT